jgi:hypothetical protein
MIDAINFALIERGEKLQALVAEHGGWEPHHPGSMGGARPDHGRVARAQPAAAPRHSEHHHQPEEKST